MKRRRKGQKVGEGKKHRRKERKGGKRERELERDRLIVI